MRFTRYARLVLTTLIAGACGTEAAIDTAPADPTPADLLRVQVTTQHDSILIGDSKPFAAVVTNQFGQTRDVAVSWKVRDEAIGTITGAGAFTAFAVGRTQVIAAIAGHADTTNVVVVPGANLKVEPEIVAVPEGDTLRFAALFGSSDAAGARIVSQAQTWSTSDTLVAMIDSDGLLVARDSGDVTISVATASASATAQVSVIKGAASRIVVTPTTTTIATGGAVTLTAVVYDNAGRVLTRKITWSTSAPAIATVSGAGRVTGLTKGFATISARAEGITGSALVNVGPPATASVRLTLQASQIALGATTTATGQALDASGAVIPGALIAYNSSQPSVATVNASGVVTAMAEGTTTINAISGGKTASQTLTVIRPVPTTLSIVPAAPGVAQGKTAQLSADIRDQTGRQMTGITVNWSSSTPGVATVSNSGLMTGVSAGTTSITASAAGLSKSATATVTPVPVATVSVSPSSVTLDPAQTQTLAVVLRDAAGNVLQNRVVDWSSSAPTVATVNSVGQVTGVAAGSAVITALSEGQTATVSVTVTAAPQPIVGSVTVTLNAASITVGQKTQATASVFDQGGAPMTGQTITYASSAPTVASVSATGQITALAAGSTTITATAGGVSGAALLSATPAPTGAVASVTVALSKPGLVAGGSALATSTLKDANGTVVSGVVSWSSSAPTVATVSSNGTVSGIGAGTANIRAQSGTVSGAAPISVTVKIGSTNPPATIAVTPSTATLDQGTTLQLSDDVRDAGGAPVSATVTWSSQNSAIATVSANGLVTAVAAGTTSIVASTSTGLTASASITVTAQAPAPVATVTVSLAASSIQAGQGTQGTAVAKDAAGNVLTRTVAWSSSNTGVATVATNGLVTGVTPGSATITAIIGGVSGSASVSVTQPPAPPPPPAGSIALLIKRYDNGSGTVLVSNGIPLAQGALFPNQLRNFRVLVNGVEQSIYAEALTGLHRDGSLRTIFVQFYNNVPVTGQATGALVLGQARTTTDIPAPTANRTTITAFALPSDPNYLVQTDLNGPTITSAAARALGGVFNKYEGDFAYFANVHWNQDGASWSGANYYDRALIYYAMWVRTGNPDYFYRGTAIAVDYRVNYLEANAYATSPHWSQVEGLEQHYLLSGDSKTKFAVARVAEQMRGYPLADTTFTLWMESRIQARSLQALYTAWRIGAVGPANLNLPALIDKAIDDILKTQRSDGSFGWPNTCDYSLSYMNGLLNDVFIKVHTYYRADPRMLSMVQKNADYLWNAEWLSASNAFKYITQNCTSQASGYVGGPVPAVDLNNLFVTSYSWLYNRTGNATYKTRADQIFAGAVNGSFINGSKQFNQQYTSSFRYLAYRQ